jgi:putative chitinase
MPIQLTADGLRKIFPRAPQDILDAFLAKQDVLDKAGINHTRTRLSYFFANIEHECDGFTIRNLTENTNYSHTRAAQVWPNRFRSAADVVAKYGDGPGWQLRMFDDVYGNRMGNRPGTHDGSLYIGRAGPQWTGRDGYEELEQRTGLYVIANPTAATRHDKQPEICAAFWDWKRLNEMADTGNFKGVVKRWNGGTNGMADRLARLSGNDPIIARLQTVDRILPQAKALPGEPPTKEPPKEVIDNATKKERVARNSGAGSAAAGGGSKAVTEQPAVPVTKTVAHSMVEWTLIGVGVAVVIIAVVLIARKKAAIIRNWF